jgi:hypothetical protein
LVTLVLVCLCVSRWHRLDRGEDRSLVLIALFMLLLAVRASRNVVPFGLVVGPAVSVLLWKSDRRHRRVQAPSRWGAAGLRGVAFTGSLVVAAVVVQQQWFGALPPADWVPVRPEAAAAIRNCPGPIYNHFDTGGFLIWFVPEQRVFLDSRHDPYPDELLRAQREATSPAVLGDLLTRYRIRCAVMRPTSPDVRALRGLGWTETYEDALWVIMTKPAGSPPG